MRLSLPSEHTGGAWLSALVLAAVGLWCTRGTLDIVSGTNGLARVGMLPPWWLLAAFIVTFSMIGIAAARAGRSPDAALPLCALGLLALPYLPWLPDRLPALMAAAGPARDLLWLVILWLIVACVIGGLPSRPKPFVSPSAIFLSSVLVFGVAAWQLSGTPLFPGGDEPHYLVMTQSLLTDGDLRIENNHQREDYRAYFNRELRPDYLARGVDGEIYSVHPVGLPVLAAPAFAVGGYRGVVVVLVLMAAFAATLLWQWARTITGSTSAATFGWAAAALTGPFLFNSFTVYPEIPAALAVMVALAWRAESTATPVMLIRGAAIGALPWLSTKYAPMAAAVTVALLFRSGWNLRSMAACLAPVAAAFTSWFAFFFWIWGTVSPSAPYGSSEPMTLAALARGAPGLLFDQEYGVVAYAPILAVAFVGAARMLRSGGAAAHRSLEVTLIFGALLGTVGGFHLWWGGTASPGRPLASGLLLLGVPIASLYASTVSRPSVRAGFQVLLASSLAVAGALGAAQGGALLNNDRNGSAALLEWASPAWPVSSAFPSYIADSWIAAAARTLAWLAAGAVVFWLVHSLRPRRLGAAALATLVLGFAGAMTLVPFANTVTELPPALGPEARGRVPLLDGFDAGRRPTAILYDPLSRISSAAALSRVVLVARPGLRTAPQPIDVLWNARFALPAGEYSVELRRPAGASRSNTILGIQVGRVGPPLEQWIVAGDVSEYRLTLPIDAIFVGFRAPSDLARSDGELRITPVRVVDERKRVGRPPVLSATRYGMTTAFFHDDVVVGEPNGYWTRGGATTQITYAADAASPATIDVLVHCGPVTNRVTLATPGWTATLVLEPGNLATVAIPTAPQPDPGVRVAALDVSVQDGFVPADVDRTSADRRFLGCWIGAQPAQ
jgi:hypothetical protein